MKVLKVVLMVGAALAAAAHAQAEEPPHPIDKHLNDCMLKDGTTAGMVSCSNAAYASWDAELNKQYRELVGKLNAADLAKLKDSQRKWLSFRDAEFAFIDTIYAKLEGSMWRPSIINDKLEIVKDRAVQLKWLNFKADERSTD